MANSTILYACTEDGLAIVNKPGTSSEWLPPRVVLAGSAIAAGWGEPGPPIRVIALDWEGLLQLSENGGRTWSPVSLTEKAAAIFQMGDAMVPYVVLQKGALAGSQDGGITWSDVGWPSSLQGVTLSMGEPVVVGGDRLYLIAERAGEPALVRVAIDGTDWRVLGLEGAAAAAYDPGDGTLYAMTEEGVQSSSDWGDTWALLAGSPEDGNAMTVIAAPAGKPATLLVSSPAGLFHSEGAAWQPVELPHGGIVTAFQHDPQRRDRLYAATSTGYLYESGNRGHAWQPVNAEPFAPVSSLFVVKI